MNKYDHDTTIIKTVQGGTKKNSQKNTENNNTSHLEIKKQKKQKILYNTKIFYKSKEMFDF